MKRNLRYIGAYSVTRAKKVRACDMDAGARSYQAMEGE